MNCFTNVQSFVEILSQNIQNNKNITLCSAKEGLTLMNHNNNYHGGGTKDPRIFLDPQPTSHKTSVQ